MKKILIAVLIFTSQAFAQTFVARQSETILSFTGTLLSKGVNRKATVTLRETSSSQDLLIVLEVKDFLFPTDFEQDEFNETFMESIYFPQIRISGVLKEKIDLKKDGIYIVNFPAKISIRKQSQNANIKTRIEITGDEAQVSFENILTLSDYYIPYSGEGSEIGKEAEFAFKADLIRTH
jgi:hypothetical protein